MAVGFPTKANWAAGDVLTAAQMDDLAGTVNTLAYVPPRNPILNSNFSVWQRGTSTTITTTAYVSDRWCAYRAVSGSTVSRQATGDTTNLPNIQYAARVQRDNANASTSPIYFGQPIESLNSIPFAGKAVTLSFYARSGSGFSAASSALSVYLQSGTGTDQNNVTGSFTGLASPISSTATLTTTWQRFTFTGTVAATATELGLQFSYAPVGTAGAADYFEITGVQLELGSTASTYYPNGNTYQAELAACQRYYWRASAANNANSYYSSSFNSSTTAAKAVVKMPVTMRIKPSFEQTGTASNYRVDQAGGNVTCSSVPTLDQANEDACNISLTATGLTSGAGSAFLANTTASYIGFSAEL